MGQRDTGAAARGNMYPGVDEQPPRCTLALLHRALLKKGAELNARLVELLTHEGGARVLTPGVLAKPGERPVERMRRFMALVDRKIQASKPGAAPGYGRCESCESPLPFIELEQLPWADRCRACAEPAH